VKRIAVVDDEQIVRQRLDKILTQDGYQVETFASGEDFLARLADEAFDLVWLDIILPGMNGMEILVKVRARYPDTQVVLITGQASINAAIEAVKRGAYHYLAKPFKLEEIRHITRMALEHRHLVVENRLLRSKLSLAGDWGEMVGVSAPMQEIFALIRKIAPLDCSVLIQGESGTGKELVAQQIHRLSLRHSKPFVAFNAGSFTEELIASELFGHEKGAFTGAVTSKVGLLETAHGGTVFFDEIGDMPLSMQVKLLRVIQERQIVRVGGNRPLDLNVRFLAASNKDLKQEMQSGRFRGDLYFRLNVVEINLPRLRDRQEDILPLINYFLTLYNRKFGKNIAGLDKEARQLLLGYTYPGNVRELANIIERAVALADQDVLRKKDLPPQVQRVEAAPAPDWVRLADREREYIRQVLQATHNNIKKAAEILDVPHTSLWRKIKRYGLLSS